MWATTVSFSCYANPKLTLRTSLTDRIQCKSLKLRASFFDYPLASRIMVRNLPYSTSESSLHEKFSNFGQIAEGKSQVFPRLPSGRSVSVFFSPSRMSHSTLVAVKLVKDENTKRSRGFAFIQFTSQDDAMLALENMDNQTVDGRLIYVEIAKPRKHDLGGYPKTSGPPRQQQHLQHQEEVADCWY